MYDKINRYGRLIKTQHDYDMTRIKIKYNITKYKT